jgi:hypothetical protein
MVANSALHEPVSRGRRRPPFMNLSGAAERAHVDVRPPRVKKARRPRLQSGAVQTANIVIRYGDATGVEL